MLIALKGVLPQFLWVDVFHVTQPAAWQHPYIQAALKII